jgi:hypothetical protein
MGITLTNHDYKNQARIVRIIGVLLLLGGIAIGFLGPLEMYCFYLFSEGGRFYYEGFGFFGRNTASYNLAYSSIIETLLQTGELRYSRMSHMGYEHGRL